jgi:hypothetical protein
MAATAEALLTAATRELIGCTAATNGLIGCTAATTG